MPTESAIPGSSGSFSTISSAGIKCSLCGAGAAVSSSRDVYGVVLLSDPPERICGTCAIVQNGGGSGVEDDLGHRLRDMTVEEGDEDDEDGRGRDEHREDMDDGGMFTMDMGSPTSTRPMPISTGVPIPSSPSIPTCIHSQSLPNQSIRPWKTSTPIPPILEKPETPKLPSVPARIEEEEDGLPNPLLDVTKKRNPSIGRGALFAGSIFKGTQTSGRSAYDVEVRFVDVNFTESTVSGYLSISNLTDAHPHLTTFFTGEIVGPQYGFITGSRYGATEHDDMRHWGRFEQFRRPSTRADIVREEMLFRDPLPDRNKGETVGRERDFVFLRIKERFLVPDHTVRDISGASFAGFYFAMIDLAPITQPSDTPFTPTSPTAPKATLSTSPTSPTVLRRMSSSGILGSGRPEMGKRRRQSSVSKREAEMVPVRGEATIRGYYFHSLNQEPFQELFLTHVPAKSDSTFELR